MPRQAFCALPRRTPSSEAFLYGSPPDLRREPGYAKRSIRNRDPIRVIVPYSAELLPVEASYLSNAGVRELMMKKMLQNPKSGAPRTSTSSGRLSI